MAIDAAVRRASPDQVVSFDAWYRHQADWSGVTRPHGWAFDALGTAALATCHGSGFVRERALRAVSAYREGVELPFLLLRLNDWIPQVRFVAGGALRQRLVAEYAAHWVKNLALLQRVALGQRAAHEWLTRALGRLLAQPECRPAVLDGLRTGARDVRRACVRLAAESGDPTLLLVAVRDPDAYVSEKAAAGLCRTLEHDALQGVLALLRKGGPRSRCLALEAMCERFPTQAEPYVRSALMDRASSVRELARFVWTKHGFTGPTHRDFYRAQLAVAPRALLETALRGLAETGTREDVASFVAHIDDPSAVVREAAILGLGRCDGENQIPHLVRAVLDPSLRVARAAGRYVKLHLGKHAIPARPRKRRPAGPR